MTHKGLTYSRNGSNKPSKTVKMVYWFMGAFIISCLVPLVISYSASGNFNTIIAQKELLTYSLILVSSTAGANFGEFNYSANTKTALSTVFTILWIVIVIGVIILTPQIKMQLLKPGLQKVTLWKIQFFIAIFSILISGIIQLKAI